MSLVPGTLLGPYTIIAPLGAGGMGEVYRARDERLGREVAIKMLPAEMAGDSERLKRFEREARATAALSHPNILAVHDVGRHDGAPYLVEELLDGESLKDRLDRGALPIVEALRIGFEIARGLAAAHEKGIVHRDLKPGNVFVTRDGTVKVLDFGLAKLLPVVAPDEAETVTLAPTATTQLGWMLGTLAYMAPEQARGRPVDRRTDVFAFGVVLYEMLSGKRPFRGATRNDVVAAILKDEPMPLPVEVPEEVATVVMRCLAKDPNGRYQGGSDVRAALEALKSGVVAVPGSPSSATASRHRQLGTALLVIAGLATVIALDPGGVRRRVLGGSRPARSIKLAVLPFANLSGDPEQEYLSDGLTQEMIAQLGRLQPERLSVIARTSVMRYKAQHTPVNQIGRELAVEYVLEGGALREGNLIRISAELIQVRDQTQLWADVYEQEFSGILVLQSEVSRKVAAALALTLLPAEQARLADVRTVDPEAYEAYLKGTQSRIALTEGSLETAERYFARALERDPSYAAAWAGIARVWSARRQMGIVPPDEATREAKAATLKALQLNETDLDAHRALAGILTWSDWDWPAAEREWQRVVDLDPNDAEGLSTYSHFLMTMGRYGEGLDASERALELDPFNVKVQSFHAIVLLYARRYDEAIATARAALRVQPDAPVARDALRQALYCSGRDDEALDLDRQTFSDDSELIEALERGYAEAGYVGARRRWADVWATRFGTAGGRGPLAMAVEYVYGKDDDRALEWLERAYEDHDPNLPYLGLPTWDPLRHDPRFQRMMRRLGIS